MSGLTDLQRLLAELDPHLQPQAFVFCSIPGAAYGELAALAPVAAVREDEGLTLVLERGSAEQAGLPFEGEFREIVLGAHSSLEAVGLTAAVSGALAAAGISANLVAGLFHDHVFVPSRHAEQAMQVLRALG